MTTLDFFNRLSIFTPISWHQLPAQRCLLAFLLGMISVLGFAPCYAYPLPVLALAGLFRLIEKAPSRGAAFGLAYSFGLGLMLMGVSWIYISLHVYGGMPMIMAAIAVLLFCAFLALFYGVVGWLAVLTPYRLIGAPLYLVTLEWVRGWIFTGFPWLNMGNSQIPNSPLAGLAPILGIYGISLTVAFVASLLVVMMTPRYRTKAIFVLLMIWISSSVLKHVDWTQPVGAPISVALVQGNIPQELKWDPHAMDATLSRYLHMADASPAQLIVMPEAALPMLLDEVPKGYLTQLQGIAKRNHGDMLFGVLEAEKDTYFNSVLSVGSQPMQRYRKHHLVPFGEYIPLKSVFGWIYRDWLNMPISDLSRGEIKQPALHVADQQVGVNICYEDVFGEEIIHALPEATLLVNTSNMAWFGNSWSPDQHLQMSQARALETGRMMLRATNTGATAIINTHGDIIQRLPYFETATLSAMAQGYQGMTPYAHVGNWPVLMLIGLGIVLLLIVRKRHQPHQ